MTTAHAPTVSTTPLSAEQIAEREAMLRRYRLLLVDQRNRLHSYLNVLDHQQSSIEHGEVEKLEIYVRMESDLIKEISSIQKVLTPIESLVLAGGGSTIAGDIIEVRQNVDQLRTRVVERNSHNRALLRDKMELVRSELLSIRSPRMRRSLFDSTSTASMIDIST